MIGWQLQFSRLTVWMTAAAFGSCSVVAAWASLYLGNRYLVDAGLWFGLAVAMHFGRVRWLG